MTEITDNLVQIIPPEQHKGGVKTDEGKAITRLNATKHGLLAKETLMYGECPDELLAIQEKFRNDFNPQTEIELFLIDKMTSALWRMRRAILMEREVLIGSSIMYTHYLDEDSERYARYETMHERSFYRALHELQRIQAGRANGTATPAPIAIDIAGRDD